MYYLSRQHNSVLPTTYLIYVHFYVLAHSAAAWANICCILIQNRAEKNNIEAVLGQAQKHTHNATNMRI